MCDVSARDTAVIYGLEPLWGAGFPWFILGERWGMAGSIGAALVLGNALSRIQPPGSLFTFIAANSRAASDVIKAM